jgi:hypothetical protein
VGSGTPVKEIAYAKKAVLFGAEMDSTQVVFKIIVTAVDIAADKIMADGIFGISGDYGFRENHGLRLSLGNII